MGIFSVSKLIPPRYNTAKEINHKHSDSDYTNSTLVRKPDDPKHLHYSLDKVIYQKLSTIADEDSGTRDLLIFSMFTKKVKFSEEKLLWPIPIFFNIFV